MSDRVTLRRDGAVAHVRLNRPDKLNAIDAEMFKALVATGEQLASDPTVRAVVLSGEGRAFCAGLDFESFNRMAESSGKNGSSAAEDITEEALARAGGSRANAAQRAALIWTELPVPVIAAVRGFAFGGGLQIALGADLRLAAEDAQFSVMEINWGLIPDMCGVQKLRHLVRLDVAKELTLTGRIVGAEEAVRIGLATRLCEDPVAAATEMATGIAERSPHAVRAAKRLLDAGSEPGLAAGLALEERLQRSLIGTPNQVEAVRANFEKRPARFSDPT